MFLTHLMKADTDTKENIVNYILKNSMNKIINLLFNN